MQRKEKVNSSISSEVSMCQKIVRNLAGSDVTNLTDSQNKQDNLLRPLLNESENYITLKSYSPAYDEDSDVVIETTFDTMRNSVILNNNPYRGGFDEWTTASDNRTSICSTRLIRKNEDFIHNLEENFDGYDKKLAPSQCGPAVFTVSHLNQVSTNCSDASNYVLDDICLDSLALQLQNPLLEIPVGWPSFLKIRGEPPIPNMPTMGIRGLRNIDFRCWLNVIIQVVASQPAFRQFLTNGVFHMCYLDVSDRNGVLSTFSNIIKKIWNIQSEWVIDRSCIVAAVRRRIPSLNVSTGSHVLSTAFGQVIHSMREEINAHRTEPVLTRAYNSVRSIFGYEVPVQQVNTNFITNLFNGVYLETKQCNNVGQCGASETHVFHFYTWPLQLRTRSAINIATLFLESLGEQHHEVHKCTQCSQRVTRSATMVNFPNFLVFTVGRLNREGGRLVKFTSPVVASSTLNFNTQNDSLTYALTSFVREVKIPGSNINHVIAYVRHIDTGRWFEIDNDVFREVDFSTVTFENLVLAAYTRG